MYSYLQRARHHDMIRRLATAWTRAPPGRIGDDLPGRGAAAPPPIARPAALVVRAAGSPASRSAASERLLTALSSTAWR